ncbi:hypothetical protein R3P38DRAFT_3028555 [Favolaschia claudopus]|uniref:Uncharacterized protein n=1 Tax=Favolaschia claudopus TaxID=2862362 RepID=A0AAW0AGT4_9AGAR
MFVGFIGWCLDRTETWDDPRLIAVFEQNPVAVWFAFARVDPTVDLGRYIDHVHAYNARTGRNIFIIHIRPFQLSRGGAQSCRQESALSPDRPY